MSIVLYICAAVCFITQIVVCFRFRKPMRALVLCALSGVAALAAVNLLSPFTGVHLGVNLWTAGCSLAGGLPGVILMLAVKAVWLI